MKRSQFLVVCLIAAPIALAVQTDPVAPAPEWHAIEPFAVLGWDSGGAVATFVWAVDDAGTLSQGITVRGERVRGSPNYAYKNWPSDRPMTLQRLLGFSDRQVLEAIKDTIDRNTIIEILGIGGCAGDVNGDGVVDLRDLNLVMANFGKGCD